MINMTLNSIGGAGHGGACLYSRHLGSRSMQICEFKSSLIYKASSRTSRTVTQRNVVSTTPPCPPPLCPTKKIKKRKLQWEGPQSSPASMSTLLFESLSYETAKPKIYSQFRWWQTLGSTELIRLSEALPKDGWVVLHRLWPTQVSFCPFPVYRSIDPSNKPSVPSAFSLPASVCRR